MSTNANKSGQTLIKLVLALLIPIVIIVSLVKSFSSQESDPALLTQDAIENRIAPIAKYNTGAPVIAKAKEEPKGPLTGEQVYKKLCMACHDAGLAGAPKQGDADAWAPRIAQGEETVFNHAINGLNGMPAKGGGTDLSDLEVKRAVVYMVNASGGQFAEPTEAVESTESATPSETAAQ